jgi:hypothetical protein
VVGDVEGTVDISQRYASEVPEDEHEAPFFEIHVPVSRSCQFLLLLLFWGDEGWAKNVILPTGDDQLFSL